VGGQTHRGKVSAIRREQEVGDSRLKLTFDTGTMTVLDDWHHTTDQWPLAPFIFGALAIPYLIAYLSFDPSTRWLRIGLWPMSVFCYFAALGRVDDGCESFVLIID